MPRPAAVSRDQIRATILAMLAEAGMDAERLPPSGARFRQVVSVRKLRARLGAGDPTTLSRALNDIEAEVVQTGLAGIAIPDLPEPIAEQMRALWHAAVAVQLDDVVRLRDESAQAAEKSDAARRDAELRTEMLKVELNALRGQVTARDSELAELRAQCRSLSERATTAQTAAADVTVQLEAAHVALDKAKDAHSQEFANVHTRYEGLSRQLLQETAHQRHAFQVERDRLVAQIGEAAERVTVFEGLRERLLTELAAERAAHRDAVAEVTALKSIVTEQRIALQATRRTGARAPRPSAANTAGRASRPTSVDATSTPRRRSR